MQNHDRRGDLWIIFHKKHSRKHSATYADAVEEALCFGWIDGILRRIDEERYMVRFTPRRANSIWSALNKRRALKMMREGKMTNAGLEKIGAAKRRGTWKNAAPPPRSSRMPKDLGTALARNKKALKNFKNLAPGYQNIYATWVDVAKKEETRRRRIREVLRRTARNEKPGML